MESMRDVNRMMEREIKKGSCPLKLEKIMFEKDAYREIASKEKLLEVLAYLLRTGEYGKFAEKTVVNNIYMDIHGKKPVFKRTRTAMERKHIFTSVRRYARRLKPDFGGNVCLETVRCVFIIPEEDLVKYRYTCQGKETYAFLMSDKYMLALYTHCMAARKEAAGEDPEVEGFTEKEYGIIRLNRVRDVLFQCLLMDDVQTEGGTVSMNFYSIYLLKETAGEE